MSLESTENGRTQPVAFNQGAFFPVAPRVYNGEKN